MQTRKGTRALLAGQRLALVYQLLPGLSSPLPPQQPGETRQMVQKKGIPGIAV